MHYFIIHENLVSYNLQLNIQHRSELKIEPCRELKEMQHSFPWQISKSNCNGSGDDSNINVVVSVFIINYHYYYKT